jgi:hypothetical protein
MLLRYGLNYKVSRLPFIKKTTLYGIVIFTKIRNGDDIRNFDTLRYDYTINKGHYSHKYNEFNRQVIIKYNALYYSFLLEERQNIYYLSSIISSNISYKTENTIIIPINNSMIIEFDTYNNIKSITSNDMAYTYQLKDNNLTKSSGLRLQTIITYIPHMTIQTVCL